MTAASLKLSPTRPRVALGVELLAVVADDAGRFLAAMLEGVEAQRSYRRSFRVPKNTEDSAFLTEFIVAHLRITEIGGTCRPQAQAPWLPPAKSIRRVELMVDHTTRPTPRCETLISAYPNAQARQLRDVYRKRSRTLKRYVRRHFNLWEPIAPEAQS